MKWIAALFLNLSLAIAVQAQGYPSDTLVQPPVESVHVFAEGQWASNALNKFVLAGFAFGGDISFPVRSLVSLTEQKDGAFAGGSLRSGVKATLPAMGLFEAADPSGWRTTVALEYHQLGAMRWSPGTAQLAFGRHGLSHQYPSDLGGSGYQYFSFTSLKIGGLRSFTSSCFGVPVQLSLSWSINAGEMHSHRAGGVASKSQFTWDQSTVALDARAQQLSTLGVGNLLGVDLGVAMEEANGGQGRLDRWSFSLSDLGNARFREFVFDELDTALSYDGLPLITEGAPSLEGAWSSDTLVGSLRRNLPATVRLSWERHAMRTPGVVWLLRAEQNSYAPRPLIELTRRSGRGPLQASIGLGYGGWGGTYIPLSVRMPSRAVRQGRPGGTLHLTSRWLALAGTGGRMALGLNWHQSF